MKQGVWIVSFHTVEYGDHIVHGMGMSGVKKVFSSKKTAENFCQKENERSENDGNLCFIEGHYQIEDENNSYQVDDQEDDYDFFYQVKDDEV